MRPINIKIAGFGTYCKATEIDFSKLGTEGLYLITGDTGSGKTTIFDAITFALYGEPSGSNRDAAMLRSSFATLEEPTYVELEFEFHGKKYFIKRNPTYERANKRGGGTTTENADAELKMPDGVVLAGVKDVNRKIEEILGIKKSQFCQIAMIAQGDFQKLLFESSENRQNFFRTLFKTENYQKLQDVLKAQVSELKSICSSTEDLLKHEMSCINCSSNYDSSSFEEAKNIEMHWDEKVKIIEDIIDFDKKENNRLELLRNENQGELDKVKIQIANIEKLKKDRVEAGNLKESLEKKENLVNQLKETVEIKKIALDESGEKEKEKALIGNDLQKYDELDNKDISLKNLQNQIKKLEDFLSQSDDLIQGKTEEINKLENRLEDLKDVAVNHQKFINEKEKLEDRIAAFCDVEKKYNSLNCEKEKLLSAQNQYKAAYEKAVVAGETYSALNKAYLDGQAGLLAGNLVDNIPCPVCGSLVHPSPCKVSGEVPKEGELKAAKEEADLCNKGAEEKSKAAAEIGAGVKAKTEEINDVVGKLLGGDKGQYELEKIIIEKESCNKELSKVKNCLSEESNKLNEKNNIEGKLPGIKTYLEKLKKDSIEKNNQLIQNRAESESLSKQISELKANLKFESKNEAKSRFAKLEQQIDYIKKSYETALEQFTKENNIINELRGSFSAVSKRIENEKIENEDEIVRSFEKLSENNSIITKQLEENIASIKINQQALDNINKNVMVLIKNENKLSMIESLSATANGTLGGGHEKIQLETYIQMAYFDKILHHANTRLLIMSDGQYELVRKTEGAGLRSKTGLDLNVIDHYTGCERSVKSLSGGECFQASLSLALGLSDEVTSSAGGIKIDTMFVDEGFGTLDPETIQKAYKALISVTQGNKLVGIISHVDYLKEKIDKQIVVTKSRDMGSSVTIRI